MKLIVSGCRGKMGRKLIKTLSRESDIRIICGIDNTVDKTVQVEEFPVFAAFGDHICKADAVIDFSHPTALKPLLAWCILNNCPVVIATTGLSPNDHRIIQEAAKQIPIFRSSNMSPGITVICRLLNILTSSLGMEFDVEIIEKHHKNKEDAPSGTVFMLEEAIGKSCPTHSIRAGTIPGEHTIIFAGSDEIVELTHIALSRTVYARGALAAVRFLINQKPGLYSMKDLA